MLDDKIFLVIPLILLELKRIGAINPSIEVWNDGSAVLKFNGETPNKAQREMAAKLMHSNRWDFENMTVCLTACDGLEEEARKRGLIS